MESNKKFLEKVELFFLSKLVRKISSIGYSLSTTEWNQVSPVSIKEDLVQPFSVLDFIYSSMEIKVPSLLNIILFVKIKFLVILEPRTYSDFHQRKIKKLKGTFNYLLTFLWNFIKLTREKCRKDRKRTKKWTLVSNGLVIFTRKGRRTWDRPESLGLSDFSFLFQKYLSTEVRSETRRSC